MNLATFKKIVKQVSDLEKTGVEFDVQINYDAHHQKGATSAEFQPTFFTISSLAQLAQVQKTLNRTLQIGNDPYNSNHNLKVEIKDLQLTPCTTNLTHVIKSQKDFLEYRRKFNSLKFYTPLVHNYVTMDVTLISSDPFEQVEDGITYRFIGTKNTCQMCVPHDSPMYVYLDKGFSFVSLLFGSKEKVILTNELTADTYLVMHLCHYNQAFLKQLDNECFVNFNKAKLLRIKFEKELGQNQRISYERVKNIVMTEFEKSVNSNLLVKVAKGELPTATFNNIKITPNSANYEGVVITYPKLLEYMQEVMVFDDRTDIYGIIDSFVKAKVIELETATFPKAEAGKEDEERTIEIPFNINGIDIVMKRTTANSRRFVNNMAINMEEVEEVCYRASCFKDQATYNKFVTSVHNMSLKWHDAIGSGLPVKIHDGLTAQEYSKQEAPISCPRIRFMKDDRDVYLVTGPNADDKVKVKLNLAMKRIAKLNRMTNNKYNVTDGYSPRNARWARKRLVKVLKECCTFEKKQLITDAEGKPVLDGENKRTYNVTNTCLLTDEKAAFIGKMAEEAYEKAVQRSKVLLDMAVQKTGAKAINFNGEECWYVEGTLHKYAVSKKTNHVFNYDTNKTICIVEPGHRVEVGFDATVSRLMALKNDSVVVSQVGTLRNG